jgi:predicted RNA polymerase sigma factor
MKYSLQQLRIEVHQQWKKHGRPNDPTNSLVIGRKETTKIFRRELQLEENKRRHEERNRIMRIRTTSVYFSNLSKSNEKMGMF